jgi:hypothetical protein
MAMGERSDVVVLIESGVVKVALSTGNGIDVVSGLFGPGEMLGELGVLHFRPRSATVADHRNGVATTFSRAILDIMHRNWDIRALVDATQRRRLRNADHRQLCTCRKPRPCSSGGLFDCEHIHPRSGYGDRFPEVAASSASAGEHRKSAQVLEERSGAGSMPSSFMISYTVDAATFTVRMSSSPWSRRCPQQRSAASPAATPVPGRSSPCAVVLGVRPGLGSMAACDQVAVPFQHRVRTYQQPQPMRDVQRQPVQQRRQQRRIARGEPYAAHTELALQHRDLLAQGQDLDIPCPDRSSAAGAARRNIMPWRSPAARQVRLERPRPTSLTSCTPAPTRADEVFGKGKLSKMETYNTIASAATKVNHLPSSRHTEHHRLNTNRQDDTSGPVERYRRG